jgi:hypothetical protein
MCGATNEKYSNTRMECQCANRICPPHNDAFIPEFGAACPRFMENVLYFRATSRTTILCHNFSATIDQALGELITYSYFSVKYTDSQLADETGTTNENANWRQFPGGGFSNMRNLYCTNTFSPTYKLKNIFYHAIVNIYSHSKILIHTCC